MCVPIWLFITMLKEFAVSPFFIDDFFEKLNEEYKIWGHTRYNAIKTREKYFKKQFWAKSRVFCFLIFFNFCGKILKHAPILLEICFSSVSRTLIFVPSKMSDLLWNFEIYKLKSYTLSVYLLKMHVSQSWITDFYPQKWYFV